MNRNQTKTKELQADIFMLIDKEPDISTLEIARRLKIAPNTARKHRKEINNAIHHKYEGIFSGISKLFGIKA